MIRLQFVACNDPGSEAIRIFSRGWPSHVDAITPDNRLLGARMDGGVMIRPADYEHFDRRQVVELDATPEQVDAFWHFMVAQLGKPYDKLAIAAFPVGRDWRTPDAWFCSELVAAALEACGWFRGPLANPANEITPRDLLLVVSPWAAAA